MECITGSPAHNAGRLPVYKWAPKGLLWTQRPRSSFLNIPLLEVPNQTCLRHMEFKLFLMVYLFFVNIYHFIGIPIQSYRPTRSIFTLSIQYRSIFWSLYLLGFNLWSNPSPSYFSKKEHETKKKKVFPSSQSF